MGVKSSIAHKNWQKNVYCMCSSFKDSFYKLGILNSCDKDKQILPKFTKAWLFDRIHVNDREVRKNRNKT